MTPGRRRLLVIAMWLGVIITPAYWILWYAARSSVASKTTSAYYEFENAFPLADGWLVVALIAALVALRHGWDTAPLYLAAAGGAAAYLFCMDVLYDIENKIWWTTGAGGWIELVINVLTLILAELVMSAAWSLYRLKSKTTGA